MHRPCLQVRVRRAPHTKINYRATKALLQEVSPLRPHLPHLRDKGLPTLFEISFLEIIDTIRMPERGAEPEEPIVTDVETVIARPAMKKMVAVREG